MKFLSGSAASVLAYQRVVTLPFGDAELRIVKPKSKHHARNKTI